MSRSITIPEYKNPFVVTINNTVYQYKGGETVEVPDEVAEAIEDALDEIPKAKIFLSRFAQFVEGSVSEVKAEELEGIETITTCAFYNYKNLISVTVPHGVKSIQDWALGQCAYLKKVVLPDGLNTIGGNVFLSCSSLSKVTLRALVPPSIQADTFKLVPNTCVIEVPAESVEAYKAAPNWSTLASQIKAIEE